MRAEQTERLRRSERYRNRRSMGETAPDDSPLSPEENKAVQGTAKTLMPVADELIPCAKVTKEDLPDCSDAIPRLAGNSWWLTEQKWTLQPDMMRDLDFEPAWPIFTELLGTEYGYYADASLTSYGADGVPAILAAMQSTNTTVRVTAAAIFYCEYGGYTQYGNWKPDTIRDPRIAEAAPGWLKDPAPEVRKAGILTMIENWDPKFAEPLIAMIRDKDPDVRFCATALLGSSVGYLQSYIPVFEEMLNDSNPDVRGSALQILQRLRAQIQIPRKELMPCFNSRDYRVLDAAFAQFQDQGEKLSDDDALVLLQNPEPVARLLGLDVLEENPTKQSIELALPLLEDLIGSVRVQADETLRMLTGQNFTAEQTDEWIKWWDANKTGIPAQLHPAEWYNTRP
jgi:HEAT repeat